MEFGARGRRVDVESLERENDRGVDLLSEKVALLKQATHNIKNEADSHLGLLDKMDASMFGVRGLLSSVNDKFRTVMNSKQGVNMVMGTAGCIVGLILLWYFLNR